MSLKDDLRNAEVARLNRSRQNRRDERALQQAQAVQALTAVGQVQLASLLAGARPTLTGTVASVAIPAVVGFLASSIYASYNRPRFPQQKPGELGLAIREAGELRERGLQPVITTNPYTGELTIASADQPIPQLLFERAFRQAATPSPAETRALYDARADLIQRMEETAVERGFYASVADLPKIPSNLVCGVTRRTADGPLEYVCRSRP